MQLPKSKIEKAAAIKSGRPFLEGVYIDVENGCALASDGFIAAKVPLDLHPSDDKSGLIKHEHIKAIRKAKRNVLPGEIDSDVQFPAQYIHEQLLDIPSEPPIMVLDAMKLYNLAQAICVPDRSKRLFVGLYLTKNYKPVQVKALDPGTGNKPTGGEGLIMEVRNNLSENLRKALDELRQVLVDGEQIDSKLRARLRAALVEG